jgi:hypothetical protein
MVSGHSDTESANDRAKSKVYKDRLPISDQHDVVRQ